MIGDYQVRKDVIDELRWIPDIDDANIEVQVSDGIVTLTGFVSAFTDRFHAECAAKRVKGVTGIANDIKVCPAPEERHPDTEIARRTVHAIGADLPQVAAHIKVLVSDGHVTLEGDVEWHWQRQRLESTVRAVKGVVTVSNLIVVAPSGMPEDIKQLIDAAFLRNAELDAQRVSVAARDGAVTLRGTVSSLREKEEAQRTAWSAQGVRQVTNEIVVSR